MSIIKTFAITAATLGALVLSSQITQADNGLMTVYKNKFCGCCSAWSEALERIGYRTKTENLSDLDWAKRQFSVPEAMQGCHTAIIDGYVVEGHVPPQAIAKLLKERPNIRGIAVPGMPEGSLGMGYDPKARYTVYAFGLPNGEKPRSFYEAGQD